MGPEFCAQPWLQCVDQRAASLLPNDPTLVGAAAADVLLDRIQRGNALKRFAGDRRRSGRGELVEVAPHMHPAECKLHVAALSQPAVAGIAIDLQDALEAVEMGDRPLGLAVRGVDIDRTRRIGSAPWPVISGIGPQLAGLGATATGVQHRHRGLIGEQLWPLLELVEQDRFLLVSRLVA